MFCSLYATALLHQAAIPQRPLSLIGADVRQDFILTSKDALGMLTPRAICPGIAERLVWSPDGNYIVVVRTDHKSMETELNQILAGQSSAIRPEDLKRELVIYSVRDDRVQANVPIVEPDLRPYQIDWMTGAPRLVVESQYPVRNASGNVVDYVDSVELIAETGKVTQLAQANMGSYFEIYTSPHDPLVAVLETVTSPPANVNGVRTRVPPTRRVRYFKSDGSLAAECPAPADFSEFMWAPDGSPYFVTRAIKDKKVIQQWLKYSFADGKLTAQDKGVPYVAPADPGFAVQRVGYRIPRGDATSQPAHGFLLKSKTKSEATAAVVSADGSDAFLSPTNDAVAYVSQGMPMVRPFIHMDREQFLAARKAAIRAALISQAKQVTLGLLMNANDYDGNFLSNSTNWRDELEPYLKDPTLTDGFVYTFAGGSMAAIENPATTILGYIDGPGGRAVAYSDGHVKWLNN